MGLSIAEGFIDSIGCSTPVNDSTNLSCM
jgi:hypothetical protein